MTKRKPPAAATRTRGAGAGPGRNTGHGRKAGRGRRGNAGRRGRPTATVAPCEPATAERDEDFVDYDLEWLRQKSLATQMYGLKPRTNKHIINNTTPDLNVLNGLNEIADGPRLEDAASATGLDGRCVAGTFISVEVGAPIRDAGDRAASSPTEREYTGCDDTSDKDIKVEEDVKRSPVSVEEFLRGRDPHAVKVLKMDRNFEPLRITDDVILVTSLNLKCRAPAFHSLDDGRPSRPIVFDEETPSSETVTFDGKVYRKLRQNPAVYGLVLTAVRFAWEARRAILYRNHDTYLYDAKNLELNPVYRHNSTDGPSIALTTATRYIIVLQKLITILNKHSAPAANRPRLHAPVVVISSDEERDRADDTTRRKRFKIDDQKDATVEVSDSDGSQPAADGRHHHRALDINLQVAEDVKMET